MLTTLLPDGTHITINFSNGRSYDGEARTELVLPPPPHHKPKKQPKKPKQNPGKHNKHKQKKPKQNHGKQKHVFNFGGGGFGGGFGGGLPA
jgi:hypothetical protein